jgi:tRNA dimethylallyltransferase
MTAADAPIYLLAGPTASGKSDMALAWAEARDGIVLNADSMQLYADVPILTARPRGGDLERAPHVLYGQLGPQQLWSAGEWLRAARPFLDAALAGGPPVCVVGGTGLYFNSLVHGLADIPEVSDKARSQARRLYEEIGEAAFRDLLKSHDPAAEARITANDRQRLSRAYEVFLSSGTALSEWQARTTPGLADGSYFMEILLPERTWLYARCDRRLGLMVEEGALAEVADLTARGLRPDWPIMRVLGVAELVVHLNGEVPLDAALDLARQKTRNYAKRQTTWFRNQFAQP